MTLTAIEVGGKMKYLEADNNYDNKNDDYEVDVDDDDDDDYSQSHSLSFHTFSIEFD